MNQPANNPSLSSDVTLAAVLARRIIDVDGHHATISNHQLACQEIRKHRFCPPVSLRPPLICIASPVLALRDKDFAEKVLTERVEKFSQCFFSIPIEQRKKTWLKLEPRVRAFPQLAWRLNALKPGLTIHAPVPNNFFDAIGLAQHTCDAFVMMPAAAGNSLRRRFSEMSGVNGNVKETKRSLANLAREYPDIAALRPAGVMAIADRAKRARGWSKRNFQQPWYENIGFLPSTGIAALAIGVLCIQFTYRMPLIDHLNQTDRPKQESRREAQQRSIDAALKDMRSALSPIGVDTMPANLERQEEARVQREKRREETQKWQIELQESQKQQRKTLMDDYRSFKGRIRSPRPTATRFDDDFSRGNRPQSGQDANGEVP